MTPSPRDILETLLGDLGFHVLVEEQEYRGQALLQIRTREPARLIGRREEVLEAMQLLLDRILQARDPENPRVIVDVEHHRLMRDDDFLQRMSHLAGAVREHGRPVETAPLNSYDRRLLHDMLREDPLLESLSEATDARLKRVTIRLRTTVAGSMDDSDS